MSSTAQKKPMQQKNSLQAVLEKHAAATVEITSTAAPVQEPETDAVASVDPAKFHRPSRAGRRLIAGHFEPKVAKQLKLLAAEEDTTVQALLEEALDLLFIKKGKDTIKRA
jgi:hypothetical protein